MQQYIRDLQKLEKEAKKVWHDKGLDDKACAAWAVIKSCLQSMYEIADSVDIPAVETIRYDATQAVETCTTGTEEYCYTLVVRAACYRLNVLGVLQNNHKGE